ncbi:MAG: VOC family protein [Candidatus Dormibacteria bacterium]
MTSRVTEIIVDSHDPLRQANWWAEVLGYRVGPRHQAGWVPILPWATEADRPEDDSYVWAPQVPSIVFVPVLEAKSLKNRVHLDVWPIDCSRDEEVQRLIARGARTIDLGQGEVSWVPMADPEGNEFCVLG